MNADLQTPSAPSRATSTQTAIWIVRPEAWNVARLLAESLEAEIQGALPDAPEKAGSQDAFRAAFPSRKRWILLMATGIATRFLAGLPHDKQTDPAVVVMDEATRFAVPLLGGHEAGANRLAYEAARVSGAIPIITTATEALKPLTVGIGCRKGVSAESIQQAVALSLEGTAYSTEHIREAATVDRKASEPGLLKWLSLMHIPLRIFSTPQLADRPLTTNPSPWVRQQLGLAGVCEPCALLASVRGKLIVPKKSLRGVSVAVVADAFSFPEIRTP